MRIKNLKITNLRSIKYLEVGFSSVTALLGGNNAGKSTVLRALEMFFEPAPRVNEDDYFNRADELIEIIVEFDSLVPSELEEFGSAVVANTLIVKRVFSKQREDSLHYEALANVYPAFSEVRALSGKTAKKQKFNEIAQAIEGLEIVSTGDAADAAMDEWEVQNPKELSLEFRRGFFGIPNVACGKLRKKTSVHLVPAVTDSNAETANPKSSPIIALLSEISKQIYENKEEVQAFVIKAKEEFSELVDPTKVAELGGISDLLTNAVKRYYKDSELLADWQMQDGLVVEFPKPSIRVVDQGFQTALENVGHGLQRASLFAIIQFLAEKAMSESQKEEFDEAQSDIILLIEEPEIYQHPHKQLVISETLHAICEGFSKSTGIRFQVVFTTHSEKFVGIHKFQSARILRRNDGFASPSHTANSVSVNQCCLYFAKLLGKAPMTEEAFEAKMHIFSREVCEGFFADKVILVEGVTDKAVIDGFYKSKGTLAIAEGIVIVPVDGKTKMDKPLYLFSSLGIPTYPVFDSDLKKTKKNQKPQCNVLLQRVAGVEHPEDFPAGASEKICAFEGNLELYLKECIGEKKYEKMFDSICEDFGIGYEDLCKTPLAVSKLVSVAQSEGTVFQQLEDLIEAVDNLG